MESTNNFLNGIDQDRSQLAAKENTYFDATNLDIILDELNGSIVLSNTKGNKLQKVIPTSYKIHNWSVKKSLGNSAIVINGVNFVFNSTPTSTNFDLYTFIITNYTTQINAGIVSVSYDENRVVIVDNTVVPTNTFGSAITINTSLEVPVTTTHKPIGYGIINREIYIFTTPCTDTDPISTGNGYGFIWKFSYDYQNFSPSLATFQLIYGANLDWSTYWNFSQTGIVTRYETDVIKKIWFTNFYNPLRSINVADPNLMTQTPNGLSVNPNISIYKPIFVSLLDGGTSNLHSGVYQSFYKLTKNLSKDSINSQVSNLVSIGSTAMSSSYEKYVGGTPSTPKIITWQVDNIDTNFDNIEFYVVIRETDDFGINRRIVKVDTKSINNQSSIIFSVGQSLVDNGLPITDSQASVQQYNGFTHCKTIAEKDNLLIAANLKNDVSVNLSNWDARAFRSFSPNSEDIRLINSGVSTTYNLAGAEALPTNSDAINDYSGANACYYQPNSPLLGGKGVNVSYTFITEKISVDSNAFDNDSTFAYAPWFTNGADNITQNLLVKSPINYQHYSSGNGSNFYQSYKNPQWSGLLKGYQRGEIYRFGIQFYTKSMQPIFVKWIGDIKFPDLFDSNPTSPTGDFRTLILDGLGAYVQTLGIKFSITGLDTISDEIGGYSIVRVQRKYADRTIINQGFINSAITPSGQLLASSGIQSEISSSHINKFFIHYPRIGTSGKTIDNSMKIKNIAQVAITTSCSFTDVGNPQENQTTNKYYTFSSPPNYNTSNQIVQSGLLLGTEFPSGLSPIIDSSTGDQVFNNLASPFNTIPGDSNLGQITYYLRLQNDLSNIGNGGLIIANIINDNPTQYGGKTYSDRSDNTYISCGHFRPIPLGIIADPIETAEVFGGDIFVCLYDSLTYRKYWVGGGIIQGLGQIVPLETDINIDLMNDDRANTRYTKAFSDAHSDQIETGNYFTVYSAEDNLINHFPQPNVFFQVDKWINRFAASNVKINGELVDSWSTFPIADVWDADGQNGEINGICVHDSKLFFWQDKAFGIMQVNPRVYIGDLNNPDVDSQIQLGFGNKLQRHDYISNVTGTRHQGSILNTKSGLFWMDTNLKKLFKFENTKDGSITASLSDVKGLYAYLVKNFDHSLIDKPCWDTNPNGLSGICAIYDVAKDKVHYTLHNGLINGVQSSFTITYSNLTNTFVAFKSFKPSIYLSDYINTFSFDNGQTIYVNEKGNYNEFYGIKYPSYLKYIVNDNPKETKVFDNMEIITQSVNENNPFINNNDDTWNKIRVTNDYQNTDWIDLILDNNIRRPERTWKLAIPRNRVLYTLSNSPDIMVDVSTTKKLFGERMRDKYINIELQYDNPNSNLLKTSLITTEFRQSPR